MRFYDGVLLDHGSVRAMIVRVLGVAACVAAAYLMLLPDSAGRGLAAVSDPFEVHAIQTTTDLSQGLTTLPDLEFGTTAARHEPVIHVNAGVRYQSVRGFGAAMTDSSAWLIERRLTPVARQALMTDVFGSTGIDLDFVKVPMGASDFTRNGQPYTYDDLPRGRADPALAHFSISHDRGYILPALRQARSLDPATEFLATPWSPPAWMKTNHSLSNAGHRGALVRRYYAAWAAYFVKLIRAYAASGIPITAITPQNEPGTATLYPGMSFSPAHESTWLLRYLRPALERAGLKTRVYGGDLGWGPASDDSSVSARGPVRSALFGIAWHCYYGAPNVMSQLHQADPRLDEIVDECSPGISPTPISEIVISSLRNWASTVALWNLALNLTGGPAQPPNHGCPGCQGLATINPRTRTATLNQNYYELGQASAFIAPGAQRISSGNFVTYRYPKPGVDVASRGLDDVAVRNPDRSIVLLAYDNSSTPITFAVAWRDRTFSYTLPARATVTFVW
ncbi:MAG: glycoside hydrolase family 30 protein, partial [Solirubrobacteraceae bacterium]